jgi:hypothetical protein
VALVRVADLGVKDLLLADELNRATRAALSAAAVAAGPLGTTSTIAHRPGTDDSATVIPSQPAGPATAAAGASWAGEASGPDGFAKGSAIGSPIEMSSG